MNINSSSSISTKVLKFVGPFKLPYLLKKTKNNAVACVVSIAQSFVNYMLVPIFGQNITTVVPTLPPNGVISCLDHCEQVSFTV